MKKSDEKKAMVWCEKCRDISLHNQCGTLNSRYYKCQVCGRQNTAGFNSHGCEPLTERQIKARYARRLKKMEEKI